jgi:hypothetical protein
MKHLKRFNEAVTEGLDKEYLDMVFINFIDRGIETKLSPNNMVYTLEIKYEMISSIGRLKTYLDQAKEDTLDIESGMAKVKIEIPKACYTLYLKDQTILFKIYKNLTIQSSPNPEGIREVEGWDPDNDDFFDDDEAGEEDRHATWLRNR